MSISVVKNKEVTVVTVKADGKSIYPLCSPRRAMMRNGVVGALATVQIMVGLINIGLGPGRTSMHPRDLTDVGAPYWLGVVFINGGIVSILADALPSPCFAIFTVFINILGAIFAIAGIVLYGMDLSDSSSIMVNCYSQDCKYAAVFVMKLLRGMDGSLIVLAVLQLCVCIILTVLGIRALCYREKEEVIRDAETHQPLLKEVLMTSPGA